MRVKSGRGWSVLLSALLVGGALLAAGATLAGTQGDGSSQGDVDEEHAVMGSHMSEHFAEAIMLQTAVVNGDLASVHEHARWLAEHEPPAGVPDAATPMLFEFQQVARDALVAEDLYAAAVATARLGKACGDCHAALGVSNHIASEVPPPLGDDVPNRMARHLWAADRMWEALAAPSEEAWLMASEALIEAPLESEQLVGAKHELVEGLAGRVVDLAARARDTVSWDKRATIYAEFLNTCASCHAVFRGR